MSYQAITVSKKESVFSIKLNREKALNAIDSQLAEELSRAGEEANRDAGVKAVILSGAGRGFCAGGDVSLLGSFAKMSAPEITEFVYKLEAQIGSVAFIEKPVIAAIHGYALGAGLSLAMLCDFRVVADKTVFGMEFVKMGIIPEVGARLLLPSLVGAGKALELALTGGRIDAAEALKIGLVNQVVAPDGLEEAAGKIAGQFTDLPPIALRLIKQSFKKDILADLDATFRYEAEVNSTCYLTGDFQEASRAFFEKRKPVFKGK
jgi:2-(1,2-epoxy-1,2-dihydrophenyl)acetyl-CoA isomerase